MGAGIGAGTAILGHEATEKLLSEITEGEEGNEATVEEKGREAACEQRPPYDNPNRNPAQDKPLSKADIELLEKNGYDLHGGEKIGGSGSDLYKDAAGNVYEKPKGGAGPGEPINANLNKLRGK